MVPSICVQMLFFKELIGSLVSPSTWVDAGLTATYTRTRVSVTDATGREVLHGDRVPGTRLWLINLDKHTHPSHSAIGCANAATYVQRSAAQLVAWYSACAGNPTDSYFLHAVKMGFFKPDGLTADMVAKYPPNSTISALGHLDQTRSGLRSTALPHKFDETNGDIYPVFNARPPLAHPHVTSRVVSEREVYALYADLPGKFPTTSTLGYQYVLVTYNEDTNDIHLEPLISRSGPCLTAAHTSTIRYYNDLNI